MTRQEFIDTCKKYGLIMKVNHDYDQDFDPIKDKDNQIQTFTKFNNIKNFVGMNYLMKVCLSNRFDVWYVCWYENPYLHYEKSYDSKIADYIVEAGVEKCAKMNNTNVYELEQIIARCLKADKKIIKEYRTKKIEEL